MKRELFIVLFVMLVPYALGVGAPTPTNYYGYITADGTQIPTGTTIFMETSGRNVSTDGWTDTLNYTQYNATYSTITQRYFLHLQYRDLPDYTYGADNGDTVSVYVAGLLATTLTANTSQTNVQLNLTVTDSAVPTAPSSLAAAVLNISNQSILNISFTTSTDNLWTNLSYLVFRGTADTVSSSDTYIGTTTYDGTGRTYLNDTVPARKTTYYYTVYANDTSGNIGARASPVSIQAPNLVPAQVTDVEISSGNGTINLTWSAVTRHNNSALIGSDLAGYHVYLNSSGVWTLVNTTTSLSYYNDALTNLGNYTYIVGAYDLDGNEGQNSSAVTGRPSERPSITIVPADISIIKANVMVNATITSGQNLDSVSYYIYDISQTDVYNESNRSVAVTSWTYSTDPSIWAENVWHQIVVRANDTNGQNNSLTYTFKVDDTSPAVSGSRLDDSDNLTTSAAQIILNVTVSDANLYTVTCGAPGTEVSMSNASSPDPNVFFATTTASALGCSANGACIITFIATDMAGNSDSSHNYTFTVDSIEPTLYDMEVSDTIVQSSQNFFINLSATDTSNIRNMSVSVSVGNTLLVPNVSAVLFNSYANGTALGCSSGSCTLIFTALDFAGNTNTTTQIIFIDDTNPTVTSVALSNYYAQNSTNATVTVVATDFYEVASVAAEGVSLVFQGSDTWVGNITMLAGDEIVNVTVTDNAGNIIYDSSATYTIDDTAPAISYVAISDNYVQNNTNVTVTVNATDAAIYSVTAEGVSLTRNGDLWTGTIPLISSPVSVVATDNASNSLTNTSVVFTIDDTKPGINSVSLSDSYVKPGQSVTVTVNVSDGYTSTVTANSISLTNSSPQIWTGSITLPSSSSSVYVLATDEAGNTNSTNNTGFTVDSSAPAFTFYQPTSGGEYSVSGSFVFNFSVSDQNLTKVNVSIDDGKYLNGSAANGSQLWTFTGLAAGLHTAVFSAFDEAGWNYSETMNFTIFAPMNVSAFRDDVMNNIGGSVLAFNITANSTDLNNNETADVNQTITLVLQLNLSNTNVTASIPSFPGLRANWEHRFTAETNESSSKGNTAGQRAGSSIQKMLLFINSTKFLPKNNFGMAVVTFFTELRYLDVYFIEDDDGEVVYKLGVCGSVPLSVATAANACYINMTGNVTLYLPHFSGGALGNDTTGPGITFTSPSNNSVSSDSLVNLTFSADEANPQTNLCNYTITNGSFSRTTELTTDDMTNDGSTSYDYSINIQNLTNGNYDLAVICIDLKNQTTEKQLNLSVLDSTSPTISSVAPSGVQATASTSLTVTLTAATSEYALCKYASANVSYGTMTSTMGNVYGASHSAQIAYTADDASEIYYVVCQDQSGRNSTPSMISYSVDVGSGSDGGSSGSSSSSTTASVVAADDTVSTKTTQIMGYGKVAAGTEMFFYPRSSNIPVDAIRFVLSRNKTYMNMEVTSFDEKPANLTQTDNAYRYLEMKAGLVANDEFSTLAVTFYVSKSWVDANSDGTSSVYMVRFSDGKWNRLATKYMKSDAGYYYFESSLPGFSYFAIAADKAVEPPAQVEEPVVEEVPVTPPAEPEPAAVPEEPVKKDNRSKFVLAIVILALLGAAVMLYFHPKKKELAKPEEEAKQESVKPDKKR